MNFECDDCMCEARARFCISYDRPVPENLKREVLEAYEDELYRNHPEARNNG